MEWTNKKFLVFGTGKSGIAAARLLVKAEIPVRIYDSNPQFERKIFQEKYPDLSGIETAAGEFPENWMKETDILVISPGIPTDLPLVLTMKEQGIAVWGEIELAYVFGKGRVLAITGTNGKTTTTTLLGEILRAYFKDVRVVGNIGIPYTDIALETDADTVLAAEISSFQLETVHSFHPVVSAILNITPDHLDRHHTMEAYIEAKERISMNQTPDDLCVLNYNDPVLRKFAEQTQAEVFFFSSADILEKGIYLRNDEIVLKAESEEKIICRTGELNLLGVHNYENIMAACAMAFGVGVPISVIRDVLLKFQSVEHRIEYVDEVQGVRYYNDSKGTNPDAAIKGISAMNRPTCLIGGGYDKDSDYSEWIQAFDGKVKKLVLLGQTKEKIAETARRLGFEEIEFANTLEEAVEICSREANDGDAVLLSPACASWGMFRDYEERGNQFKELVRRLKE